MKHLTLERVLFLLTFATYCYFIQDSNANINTRLDLTWAIVNDGTFSIDAYHANTDDKAFRDGHFYCDKAPGVSFLGVPVYVAVKPVLSFLGYKDPDIRRISSYFIRIFTVSFFSALLCVFLFRLLVCIRPAMRDEAFFLTLAYAFGTLAFPYSTLFYSHQTAAALVLIAFYLLCKHPQNYFCISLAGLLSGLSFVTEYTAFSFFPLLFFYAYKRVPKKNSLIFFVSCFLFPVSLLLFYHAACFGSLFLTGYNFEFKKAYAEAHASGLFGISFPRWSSFTGMLFSARGLFTFSPFLFFSFPGFLHGLRSAKLKAYKTEIYLCLFFILAFFYINASYYKWWGGWGIGPRFLVPVLPFFIIGCFIFFEQASPVMRKLFILSCVYSIIVISLCTIIYPQVPENMANPLMDFILPNALKGKFAFNLGRYFGLHGFTTLLPLFVFYAVAASLSMKKSVPTKK